MYRLQLLTSIFLTLLTLTASADISVSAIFNPPRVAMGDKSQYVVEIKETDNTRQPQIERVTGLPIPQSGGLELSNGRTSTSQQTSIINGAAEYSVTQKLIIDAKPPRIGTFTIPSYVFEYKGENYRVPAATLETVERPADAGPTTDELIFLKTNTPEHLYVGQTTPIELKLYISEEVRLTGLNSFDRSADGFTISDLPDSKETVEIVKGRRYRVLNWPLSITPIQTGQQDLNFQFTVSASVPSQSNRRDPFGGRGFGSSLFDDLFGQNERFTVYTEPTQIDVRALPSEDQPHSFSGAIGDFSMQVSTDRDQTQTGEPIMLSVEISGKGNFDRISGPTIPATDDWRNYDPESQFLPHSPDNTLRGTKRFDYVMIPNQSGNIEIPEIRFAYFDAEAQRYTELSSPTIPIEVSPSDIPTIAPATSHLPSPATTTTAQPLQKELSMEEALLTLDYRPKHSYRLDTTAATESIYWIINAAIAIALSCAALLLRHRRRLRDDNSYAAHYKAKQELRAVSKSAQQAADADHFYANAQNAVRLATSCRSQQNYRTANIDELTQALKQANVDDTIIELTQELFKTADAQRFAGTRSTSSLSSAKNQLERILKAL
ncbi:BatD family protein [Coraliomargarita sp. SDUM461004]|uniref:BatD family protein n=1 Tax=Thalassobacterium sedimentorum TaxID=3041258 RepID=A0ABU1AER1_9BACT|nr:BatD family protein [Coraliomargarita sp. SDUM461004]MDQ8193215.1 BatD family protein [Coraliomargarita sp. SDUM461004]